MTARPISHPSPDLLRALAAGRLNDTEASAALAHLEACPECCLAVTTIGGGTLGPGEAAAAPAAIPPELRDHADFEVLRKLGGGGMGVVYLARDRLTHRQEVLKVVNPYLATQPGVAERFLREIRAVVQLLHPNIVTAYGALQIGGLLVLKMEYVPGDDLNTVVKAGGPQPVVNACYYARQVAAGLQYAFGKGMVHRDVKPGNLMLARDGKEHVVKILDFGLVKAMATQGGEGDPLTLTAQGMGTPAYMAPEQARDAARADVRADIYSLGCTLYFLLTGRPPFAGVSPYDVAEAHHTKTAAPLNEVRQDVPADLAAVVAKMMAKTPVQRYQEPGEVAQALKPFVKPVLKSLPAVSPPAAGKEVHREAAKPVAVPLTAIERPPPSDRTAKEPPRKKPTRQPATKSKGGAPTVLLGLAGLLIVALCGGAIYWATSGHNDTSREVARAIETEKIGASSAGPKATSAFRPLENDTWRIPPPRSTGAANAAEKKLTASLKMGTPDLKQAGAIAFAPEGILLVGDSMGAAVFAIDTGDRPAKPAEGALKVEGIGEKVAGLLGATAKEVTINGLAVNPLSGNAYLAVTRGGKESLPVVLRVERSGKIEEMPLKDVNFAKAELPNPPNASYARQRVDTITGLAYADGKVYVAGLSNEEFSSKLRAIPFPFTEADKGTSIEIYHASHQAIETNSPIRTFVPYKIGDETNLLAAYTCTPLVKVPVSSLKPGEKVKGTTIAELGNMNRPLDMIVYSKDGKDYILMANNARGVMKIPTEGVGTAKAITAPIQGPTAGIAFDTIKDLKGVMHLAKLDKDHALILIQKDGATNLDTIDLP